MRKQTMGSGVEGWGHPQPNHALQLTASSVRSRSRFRQQLKAGVRQRPQRKWFDLLWFRPYIRGVI